MKIAIIIEHFDSARARSAGSERLAVWLAHELVRAGHEVHVVCHDVSARINRYRQATLRASHDADQSHRAVPPEPVEVPPQDGLHIHQLRGMRMNTALGFRVFGVRARQWVRRHNPDIAHSFTVAYPGDIYHAIVGVYAAMLTQSARSRQTPTQAAIKRFTLRLPGKQHALLALEQRAIRSLGSRSGLRRILTSCPMITRQFEQLALEMHHHRPGKLIAELPTPRLEIDAPDPAERHPAAADPRDWVRGHYGLAKSDRVAIFVGHDFRRLGLRGAIEAVARTQSRWKLLVVGMGKMREYVELADALGLGLASANGDAGRILFVGPTRELGTLYSAADALLLPAYYEPSSSTVLDALSFGLPVIGTEFIAVADLVTAHRSGTIVSSPRDLDGLAGALDRLPVHGSTEHKALAKRARAAGASMKPPAFLESLLKLYSQVRVEKNRGATA